MSRLTDLPNVGKVLEQNLLAAGITTPEQLREVGVKEAFIRIKMQDPTACVQMLYGLAGAVEGIQDTLLPEDYKRTLREFHRSLSLIQG